jgi:hypothetical protein
MLHPGPECRAIELGLRRRGGESDGPTFVAPVFLFLSRPVSPAAENMRVRGEGFKRSDVNRIEGSRNLSVKACSIKGNVKNIFLPPPGARV